MPTTTNIKMFEYIFIILSASMGIIQIPNLLYDCSVNILFAVLGIFRCGECWLLTYASIEHTTKYKIVVSDFAAKMGNV